MVVFRSYANVHCQWLSEALAQVLQEPNERRASLVHKYCLHRESAPRLRTFAERKATLFLSPSRDPSQ